MNLSMNQNDRHREQICGCQEGRKKGRRGNDWEFWVRRCKLLHLEWINNKVLLYSTGNYIKSGINHNGKEHLKKECMSVYN